MGSMISAAPFDEQQIGIGQTWQDVIRAGNTSYQNTTGKPIQVATAFRFYWAQFQVSDDNSTWLNVGEGYEHGNDRSNCHVVVPHGWYYRVTWTDIRFWRELR